jgi:predicted molibdopterin-dependent oxidoreductase YjgC
VTANAPLWHRLVPREGATVRFTIDGAAAEARAGDLLITAILMQRPNLRRFEFGDGMRAGYCLMGACQDCWVGLADGSRVRACTTLVEDGMAVVVEASDG